MDVGASSMQECLLGHASIHGAEVLHILCMSEVQYCAFRIFMSLLQIKQSLIATGMFSDTVPCHLASGLGAGFVAVCIGSPVDVVKSRMMGTLSHLTASIPVWVSKVCMNAN